MQKLKIVRNLSSKDPNSKPQSIQTLDVGHAVYIILYMTLLYIIYILIKLLSLK